MEGQENTGSRVYSSARSKPNRLFLWFLGTTRDGFGLEGESHPQWISSEINGIPSPVHFSQWDMHICGVCMMLSSREVIK